VTPTIDSKASHRKASRYETGNGSMVAFRAKSWRQVDDFHAAALACGGTSEGPPGLRPQYNPDFYAAYVRDPDGNKLAVVCRGFTAP
jgi:predicted lactoylglutathione lyase